MASEAVFTAAMAFMILQMFIAGASAWSNGGFSSNIYNPDYGTHDWIAEATLELQTRNVTFMSSTYRTDFLLGTEAPDNPDYIGDTFEHHVYYWSSGALQDDSSALRARDMYNVALDKLKASNYKDAAFYVGAMTHYVADIGVFGHTMGSGTDWGSESVHQDYENEVDNDILGKSFPTSLSLADLDPYNATISLASKITFGSGNVKPNTWMDDNYDWTNATYRASAFSAVNEAVYYAAGAVNHLLKEADIAPPSDGGTPAPPAPAPPAPSPPPPQDDQPDVVEPTSKRTSWGWIVAGIVAAIAAVTATAIVIAKAFTKK